MRKYKYSDPTERGYIQFKLSKEEHNSLFKYRKIRWLDKYIYYYNDQGIKIHKFINKKGVIVATLSLPIAILIEGLGNYKEIWKELLSLYNQKNSGSFVSDFIDKNSNIYREIMKIINN